MRQEFIASILGLILASACVQRSHMDKFSIEVQAKGDMYYDLRIVRDSDRATIQIIPVRNGADLLHRLHVELVDLNDDGYPDLRVLGGYTEVGAWYKVWLFDVKTKVFVWSLTTEPHSSS